MKVTQEHCEAIEAAMQEFLQSRLYDIEATYQASNLTPQRLRWDLWYAAKDHTHTTREIARYRFDYNDEHLDTAFRKALYVVGLKWAAQT